MMNLVDSDDEPSSGQRKSLGIALCALGGVVAFMIWHRPAALLLFSSIAGLAWCASMLFNKDEPRSQQRKGALVPLIAGLIYAAVHYSGSPATIAVAAATAFVVLGILVLLRAEFGNRFYVTWSQLFVPMAWSVSTLLLVLVYYGVLTPIGLVLRMLGRDPMRRKFDPQATSYWVEVNREKAVDPERYFRQF